MEQITIYGKKSLLLRIVKELKKKFTLGSVHKYIVCNTTTGVVKDLKKQGLTK